MDSKFVPFYHRFQDICSLAKHCVIDKVKILNENALTHFY